MDSRSLNLFNRFRSQDGVTRTLTVNQADRERTTGRTGYSSASAYDGSGQNSSNSRSDKLTGRTSNASTKPMCSPDSVSPEVRAAWEKMIADCKISSTELGSIQGALDGDRLTQKDAEFLASQLEQAANDENITIEDPDALGSVVEGLKAKAAEEPGFREEMDPTGEITQAFKDANGGTEPSDSDVYRARARMNEGMSLQDAVSYVLSSNAGETRADVAEIRDGTLGDSDGDGVEETFKDFVTEQYQRVYGREPGAQELDDWAAHALYLRQQNPEITNEEIRADISSNFDTHAEVETALVDAGLEQPDWHDVRRVRDLMAAEGLSAQDAAAKYVAGQFADSGSSSTQSEEQMSHLAFLYQHLR